MPIIYEGQKFSNYIGMPDGAVFETQENELRLIIHMNSPTIDELHSFKSGSPLKLGLWRKNKVLFLLSDFDCVSFDCPYNASLYSTAPDPQLFGNILFINLIDSSNGKLLVNRVVSLTEDFMLAFNEEIKRQLENPISRETYNNTIKSAYRYDINEMFSKVFALCIIHDNTAESVISGITKEDNSAEEPYPGLPRQLWPFYKYVSDNGKCICVIPNKFIEEAKKEPNMYTIPISVKYVLEKGWYFRDGYPYCNIPYDDDFGADIPEEYIEL